jgi:arylsulfatase A-like enzyme
MLNRRRFLHYVAGGEIAAALPGRLSANNRGSPRPNIILCMADDLGCGDVGFNGNKIIKTPYLDAMAKVSLCFTRFYAGAPVCSPTRGSCLTGRHPYRYGILQAKTTSSIVEDKMANTR